MHRLAILVGLPIATAALVLAAHAADATPAATPAPAIDAPGPAQLIAHRLGGSSMAHMALLATPDGRDLIGHAVACALPRGASFTAIDRAGTPFTFIGAIGLAPAWAARANTPAERARLDLCLRVAGFGALET